VWLACAYESYQILGDNRILSLAGHCPDKNSVAIEGKEREIQDLVVAA